MQELRFDGRTAIVTGAGGNPSLGRCHALLLAARGANVVVNDIGELPAALDYPGVASAEAVAEEIRALGGKAVADTNSVATEEGGAAIVQTALDAFGSADIIVNNAGICRVVSFEEMTPADFRQTIDINLMGTVHTCRAAWPHMKARGYGRIVNVASAWLRGMMVVGGAAYGASKGSLAAFSSGAALELAPHGITVNTVLPGGAATPGAIQATGPRPEGPGHRASPFGLCDGRDLGAAVLYFASPAAAKVTNQQLAVDAGFSIS